MRFSLLFKQPKAFWALAFGELGNTFSYYGTQTILVLYFLHVFHLTRADSYVLYGAYAAFAYSLPILGGIIADRWLGSRNTIVIGSCLIIIGNFILMFFNHYLFCLGLATSLLGAGLYKGNSAALVGKLYQDAKFNKETGYTLLYLSINIGGMLAPLIYGLVIYSIGWNFGFLFSAVITLVSLIWFLINWDCWIDHKKIHQLSIANKIYLLICLLIAGLFLSFTFYLPVITNTVIFIVFIVSLIYLLIAIVKHQGKEKRHLFGLLLISLFGMFYFAAGLQIGTTITLFIDAKIHQGIIKIDLPASAFSSLYPLFVLLLAPFFTYLWAVLKIKKIVINVPSKLVIGIVLAALGISAFAAAALTNAVFTGIILGNLLLSAGELTLAPAVYTAISDFSPEGMKSTMMGCWLLFIALGGYLSSLLANAAHIITRIPLFHQPDYFGEFLFIASFTFFIALVLVFFIPKLSKILT